jgi:hypothetical protein
MRSALLLSLLGILVSGCAGAQDPLHADSRHYTLELENNYVRVLRFKQGPHEFTPVLDHAASVIVYLTAAHQNITGVDRKPHEFVRNGGLVVYSPASRDTEENLGDQPIEAVVTEFKAARIKSARITLDPVKLDPLHHIVELENDRARVLRTILEPHLKSPMHQHPAYVVVYLTDLHTSMKMADGSMIDNPRKPGEVAWRDALQHQTENLGEQTAMEIQIEMK